MAVQNWHVFVGSEVGLLKGVDIEKQTFSNLNSIDSTGKDEEITAMCWHDSCENKIYLGHRNQNVTVYDCDKKAFIATYNMQIGTGSINGICLHEGNIITAVESGIVKLWKPESNEIVEINTGGNLSKMTVNPNKSFHLATGGEENDLKVWDVQNPKAPIFTAKNVRNDFLDLRVPVWITDVKFKPDDKIITCTRHHQVRLYDPRTQRRPVIDMEFEKYPLMSLSLSHNEHQVVVGSSRGRMALLDLRKKLLVHAFKGFAGSIRCVYCHPTLPLVASCGLDRFLRIHDLEKHKLLKKIYLKTRLNCLLMKTSLAQLHASNSQNQIGKAKAKDIDEDEENIWNSMAVIGDKKKKGLGDERDAESVAQKRQKVKKQFS
ncbi:WD repeat-containing protein 74-like [Uloborus diversus]|uniref:WD repeat-containing protein 74-like n=1 Tax=Uloborus diversus TaxID=327109 RepID=UPI0024093220|nr:WD repeat-containing protein 74-like [Uloborus diversus]